MHDRNDRYEIGQKTGYISIAVNLILTALKVFAGILGNSTAMIADAVHSASDILTTLTVIISFKIAKKPEDPEHPYGHERAESIGAKMVAILLLCAGLAIGWQAVSSLWRNKRIVIPGNLALYAAVLSVLIKEAMYWYTIAIARKIKSTALKADAWHHRSDAISSVATFIGIGAAKIGFPLGDPIAALVVSIMISKVAYDVLKQSIGELMDSSASSEIICLVRENILSVPGVEGIDSLKTRIHGNVIYADVEILVDKAITVSEGHTIAKEAEEKVLSNIEDIKALMVHIHPWE